MDAVGDNTVDTAGVIQRAPAPTPEVALPRLLFHTTSVLCADRILRSGLTPSPERSCYTGLIAPRPDCIYLATHPQVARWYERHFEEELMEVQTLALEVAGIERERLIADEDALLHHPSCFIDTHTGRYAPWMGGPGVQAVPGHWTFAWKYFKLDVPPPRGREGETLAAWATRQPLTRVDIVRYSAERGSVAYQGSIPASRLRPLSTRERTKLDSIAPLTTDTPHARAVPASPRGRLTHYFKTS